MQSNLHSQMSITEALVIKLREAALPKFQLREISNSGQRGV